MTQTQPLLEKPLEHYNLLFTAQGCSAGLHIIKTDAYALLVQQNPGFAHKNKGDFYCGVQPYGLVDVIHQALDREERGIRFNADIQIIDTALFNSAQTDPTKDYLLHSKERLRVFSPSLHLPYLEYGADDTWEFYNAVLRMAADSLFSKQNNTGLQKLITSGSLEGSGSLQEAIGTFFDYKVVSKGKHIARTRAAELKRFAEMEVFIDVISGKMFGGKRSSDVYDKAKSECPNGVFYVINVDKNGDSCYTKV